MAPAAKHCSGQTRGQCHLCSLSHRDTERGKCQWEPFVGSSSPRGASLPVCCLCCGSVISTTDSAGSSGHLPTESELNHHPTLGPRAAGDAALVVVEAQSVWSVHSICICTIHWEGWGTLSHSGGLLLCDTEVQQRLGGEMIR